MSEPFRNGERVATTETEVAHIKEQLASNSAELAAIRVTLAELKGALTVLSWLWRGSVALAGLAATLFGANHLH